MGGLTGNVTVIQDWINKGTYVCPRCQYRLTGTAWSLSKAEHTCPRCHKQRVSDFKREHK